jgi:hypothetical protein
MLLACCALWVNSVDGDDREQRRILDQRNELADQRRQHLPERLRDDDVPIGLRAGEADGARRFDLRLPTLSIPARMISLM